jgi:hypothetical protein
MAGIGALVLNLGQNNYDFIIVTTVPDGGTSGLVTVYAKTHKPRQKRPDSLTEKRSASGELGRLAIKNNVLLCCDWNKN